MASQSCASLIYFVMICLTFKIIHAPSYAEEYNRCLRQIYYAFGNNKSSAGCFSHAVEHYTKGQNIPLPFEDSWIAIPVETNTIPDQTQNVDKDSRSKKKQKVASSSQSNPNPHVQVNSTNELMSNEHIDVTNPHVQIKSTNELESSENPAKYKIYYINYAEKYYEELETMVHGTGIFNAPQYCSNYYSEEQYQKCVVALKKFGNTLRDAAYTALTVYKLKDCLHNYFIFNYMEYITKNYVVRSPSKRPLRFCSDTAYKLFGTF